jgi:hypothetical protein
VGTDHQALRGEVGLTSFKDQYRIPIPDAEDAKVTQKTQKKYRRNTEEKMGGQMNESKTLLVFFFFGIFSA